MNKEEKKVISMNVCVCVCVCARICVFIYIYRKSSHNTDRPLSNFSSWIVSVSESSSMCQRCGDY